MDPFILFLASCKLQWVVYFWHLLQLLYLSAVLTSAASTDLYLLLMTYQRGALVSAGDHIRQIRVAKQKRYSFNLRGIISN